jgi:hypothetical protein
MCDIDAFLRDDKKTMIISLPKWLRAIENKMKMLLSGIKLCLKMEFEDIEDRWYSTAQKWGSHQVLASKTIKSNAEYCLQQTVNTIA